MLFSVLIRSSNWQTLKNLININSKQAFQDWKLIVRNIVMSRIRLMNLSSIYIDPSLNDLYEFISRAYSEFNSKTYEKIS